MPAADPKDHLRRYLQQGRDAMLWKMQGLSEYEVRRPMVPTGTNLLGLVKHCATVEWGHFGAAFGRPCPESLSWVNEGSEPDVEPDADMWAAPDETRAGIVALYGEITARSDAVIEELPLDAVGEVPWWPPEIRQVTLQHILVHTVAEVQRHAGHADIVRELVDGAAGYLAGAELLPDGNRDWWQQRRDRLEKIARDA